MSQRGHLVDNVIERWLERSLGLLGNLVDFKSKENTQAQLGGDKGQQVSVALEANR
jgi:hypothetical protein